MNETLLHLNNSLKVYRRVKTYTENHGKSPIIAELAEAEVIA
jgi:hypothetical protein